MKTNQAARQINIANIGGWLRAQLAALFVDEYATEPDAMSDQEAAAYAARLFAQALHENSNLELDWLWYATNMTRDTERRYCLKRALEINPNSEMASGALAKLPQQSDMVSDLALEFGAAHTQRAR